MKVEKLVETLEKENKYFHGVCLLAFGGNRFLPISHKIECITAYCILNEIRHHFKSDLTDIFDISELEETYDENAFKHLENFVTANSDDVMCIVYIRDIDHKKFYKYFKALTKYTNFCLVMDHDLSLEKDLRTIKRIDLKYSKYAELVNCDHDGTCSFAITPLLYYITSALESKPRNINISNLIVEDAINAHKMINTNFETFLGYVENSYAEEILVFNSLGGICVKDFLANLEQTQYYDFARSTFYNMILTTLEVIKWSKQRAGVKLIDLTMFDKSYFSNIMYSHDTYNAFLQIIVKVFFSLGIEYFVTTRAIIEREIYCGIGKEYKHESKLHLTINTVKKITQVDYSVINSYIKTTTETMDIPVDLDLVTEFDKTVKLHIH